MITPRAAALFEIWGGDHLWSDVAGNSVSTSHEFITAALQYWLADRLWIKGGAGLGHVSLNGLVDANGNFYSIDSTAPALFAAGGVELVQAYNFTLDLQLRVGTGFYSDTSGPGNTQSYALMMGLNWY
jgi:hypothetical protein